MKKVLRTILALALVGMFFVPWPWILWPMMEPHFRGEVPPEDLVFMSQLAVGLIVYPAMFVLVIVLATVAYTREKRAPKAPYRGSVPPPRAIGNQITPAERRERERRRRRAQAGGDIAMALMLMEDNKKK